MIKDEIMHSPKAGIIAAGSGSRLRPLADELPQCNLEVGRKNDYWSAVYIMCKIAVFFIFRSKLTTKQKR